MTLIYFFLINFFGSFYQALTGFGFVLIAAPLALLFLDKFTTVISFVIVGLFLNAFLVKKIKQPINWTILTPLALASLIGLPFGIWLLIVVPISIIKIVAGSLAIIFTFLIVFQKTAIHPNKLITAATGILGGTLQTSIGMSGPPVVMLLAGSGKEKNEMRKTLVTYFLWLNIIALPLFFISGELTWERVSFGLYSLPFVFIGAYFGNKASHKLSQNTYKILALTTVTITGLISIYSGLTG